MWKGNDYLSAVAGIFKSPVVGGPHIPITIGAGYTLDKNIYVVTLKVIRNFSVLLNFLFILPSQSLIYTSKCINLYQYYAIIKTYKGPSLGSEYLVFR